MKAFQGAFLSSSLPSVFSLLLMGLFTSVGLLGF